MRIPTQDFGEKIPPENHCWQILEECIPETENTPREQLLKTIRAFREYGAKPEAQRWSEKDNAHDRIRVDLPIERTLLSSTTLSIIGDHPGKIDPKIWICLIQRRICEKFEQLLVTRRGTSNITESLETRITGANAYQVSGEQLGNEPTSPLIPLRESDKPWYGANLERFELMRKLLEDRKLTPEQVVKEFNDALSACINGYQSNGDGFWKQIPPIQLTN